MAQMRKKAPKRSTCWIFSLNVILPCLRSGFLKKKKTVSMAIPPNGKFLSQSCQTRTWVLWRDTHIQKHHLQLARSVSTPPRMGPITEEMPNILDSIAIYIALLLNGTENPTMVMPPENSAAAPAPATARPTINMTEFLAVAQMMEPSSKMTRATR